ncbi:MAG: VOC family protein [Desulfosarcinaceae bacterium]|nr:VOC family protein [Desulfosarcinaceae bacterium]
MDTANMPTVSFSLTVKDTVKALEFYKNAFGAKEEFRMPTPDGGTAHGEFSIGNTHIYISDEAPEWHAFAMSGDAVASCLFSIMVENCDQAFERAVSAGADALSPPEDQFWGMRSAIVKDPFGYRWSFGQMVEEVPPDELMKRAQAYFDEAGQG